MLLCVIVGRIFWRQVKKLWEQAKQGGAILGTPKRYFTRAFLPSFISWSCKLIVVGIFLAAFAIPVTFESIMWVVGSGSLANVVSVTPGAVGITQATNALALDACCNVPNADAVAYSTAQQLITTAWNVLVALVLVVCVFGWTGGKILVTESYTGAKDKVAEQKASRAEKKAAKRAARADGSARAHRRFHRRKGDETAGRQLSGSSVRQECSTVMLVAGSISACPPVNPESTGVGRKPKELIAQPLLAVVEQAVVIDSERIRAFRQTTSRDPHLDEVTLEQISINGGDDAFSPHGAATRRIIQPQRLVTQNLCVATNSKSTFKLWNAASRCCLVLCRDLGAICRRTRSARRGTARVHDGTTGHLVIGLVSPRHRQQLRGRPDSVVASGELVANLGLVASAGAYECCAITSDRARSRAVT